MKPKPLFYIGILIFLILGASYFIQTTTTTETRITKTPLLGILIFHSPIILPIYIAVALFLIYKGLGKKIKFV